MVVAQRFELLDELRRGLVDAHGHQLIGRNRAITQLVQLANPFFERLFLLAERIRQLFLGGQGDPGLRQRGIGGVALLAQRVQAGVQFVLPKGWKAKPDGEVITVSSADDGLQVVFWVPDEDSFEAAVKALDKELDKTIKNIKTTDKPTQDTHNGMPHFAQSGTGVVNGATIAWSVDVLGAKKPLIILTFAAPDLIEKHAADYLKLVGSIKKIE